ncbi:MAG: hydroxyacylglutathione hydrolase [Rhizobiaceae bacterium]|nr:hydroxyacylglutathione hydrolase [Rhizobiaceae bacterium]
MSKLQFHQFIIGNDNFGVLVHDPDSGQCVSIDAPEYDAVLNALQETGWSLSHIFVTHWHLDHVEGIEGLKQKFKCNVVGPTLEADKIKNLDVTVDDGDEFQFGSQSVRVISTPGHTLGMVNFYFPQAGVVFTGDTLFALGCGRVFEGDGAMMWESMQKLAALPRETIVYCGHEYTLANGDFALGIDSGNKKLAARMDKFIALREAGKPTLPTTIGEELDTNPFLRTDDLAIRKGLGMKDASDSEVFSEIRSRKDKA